MYSSFSQNNQAWLERNQEKFGSRQVIQVIVDISFVQWLIIIIKTSILLSTDFISCHKVKFGYVVFTEAETAERLFRQGGVVVRRASGERIQVQHLATGFVFFSPFFLTIVKQYSMAGPCQEDGRITCTVLPQLISKPPSPAPIFVLETMQDPLNT